MDHQRRLRCAAGLVSQRATSRSFGSLRHCCARRRFGLPSLQVFFNATPLTGIALLLQLAP